MDLTDDALMQLAKAYTRESGVRNLDRSIASVVRYIAASVVSDGESETKLSHEGLNKIVTKVTAEDLEAILGPAKYEEDSRDRVVKVRNKKMHSVFIVLKAF